MTVEGFVAGGFERVRQVFERLVDEGRETGAGLSVWRDGSEVVRLSGGWADAERRRPWRDDTLVHTYSTSKPFAALAALVAVKDGALSLDEPVGKYWKEYAVEGKDQTTLRHVLSHRAGQPAFPPSAAGVDLLDDGKLRELLASSPPEHAPGSLLSEHALTYGHLIDGVLRASTGHSLGQVYADVVRPALDLDAWFGVPTNDLHRVADLEYPEGSGPQQLLDTYPTYHQALAVPSGSTDLARLNSTAWRQAVFGAINLHATATTLAAFYAGLTSTEGPVRRLLGPHLHTEFLSSQVCGHDTTVGITLNWTLGFLRTDSIIGLGGLGGCAAWWSLKHNHACAYVTRRLEDFSRAAEIAAALDDDISIEVTCP